MSEKVTSLKGKVECDENYNDEEKDDIGLSLEKLNLGPRKKLIVLGLGGLLCQRIYRNNTSEIPTSRRPDAAYGNNLGRKILPFSFFLFFIFIFWLENL